jgi:hypothetical protein
VVVVSPSSELSVESHCGVWRGDGVYRSQISIVFVWQRHLFGFVHLLLVLIHQLLIDLHFGRGESRRGDEFELRVTDEFSSEPEEGLLEVVVGLGRDVVVLKVLLSVESDGFGLDFALLDIDFVAAEDDRDVFADTDEITCEVLAITVDGGCPRKRTMPVGDVLVGDSGGDIKHDDSALTIDVVAIS